MYGSVGTPVALTVAASFVPWSSGAGSSAQVSKTLSYSYTAYITSPLAQ